MSGRRTPGQNVGLILGGIGLLAVVCGGIAVAVIADQSVGYGERRRAEGAQAEAEGAAFGATATAAACQQEALERGPALCNDVQFECMVDAATFMRACLAVAPQALDTCAGVPPREDRVWLAATCADRGYPGRMNCMKVLEGGLQAFCEEAPPAAEPTAVPNKPPVAG